MRKRLLQSHPVCVKNLEKAAIFGWSARLCNWSARLYDFVLLFVFERFVAAVVAAVVFRFNDFSLSCTSEQMCENRCTCIVSLLYEFFFILVCVIFIGCKFTGNMICKGLSASKNMIVVLKTIFIKIVLVKISFFSFIKQFS